MLTFEQAIENARKQYEKDAAEVWAKRNKKSYAEKRDDHLDKLARHKESRAAKMQERFNQLKRN